MAPNVFSSDVVERLDSVRQSVMQHPKLTKLASLVAAAAESFVTGVGPLTIILVRSSVSFPDVTKALYGLKVALENKATADLAKGLGTLPAPPPGEALVWTMTEQGMLEVRALS